MPVTSDGLGRIVSTHAASPAQLQRAVFIAILSFLFFLAMMFAFYLRQNILYFLLATAFLLTYLITMFSWLIQKRSVVKVFENGVQFRKFSVRWEDIASVSDGPPVEVRTRSGDTFILPASLTSAEHLVRNIRFHVSAHSD
jgi:hypothetical protein